ncbi:hypothetical protein EDB81DRAFT_890677 [Dactylonectria macrodidyma]|uniref:Transmembrane protein n=1 Tax=Dactylonectria macrodidyma TaxID=307937 RepID=A0A9P9DPM2_9HYPO|nr:hypothetical protein EDB81DRAFT_890677 [Dactylonectria macrodidyma]
MDVQATPTQQAIAACPAVAGLTTSSTSIPKPSVDTSPPIQSNIDNLAETIRDLSQSLPKPKPPIITWIDTLLPVVQGLSIFGGSITFTLILGANAPPTKRFTDQMVRDLLSVAWLLFALGLAMATIAQLTVAGRDERIQARGDLKLTKTSRWAFMAKFLPFCLGGCMLGSFFLLSLVMLAYSDVGWVAVVTAVLGSAVCFTGWCAYAFMPERLDRLLGLRP